MEVISQSSKNKLLHAIAVASEMRLRVYSENNCQCNNAVNLKENEKDKNMKKFLNVIGTASTINYFQIAYCLQCEVAKQLNFNKFHFYSDPILINFTIGFAFGIDNMMTDFSEDDLRTVRSLSEFDFDACLEQLKTSSTFDNITSIYETNPGTSLITSLAEHLYSTQIYDEAKEFYHQLLKNHQSNSKNDRNDEYIAWMYNYIGICKKGLQKYNDALPYF